MWLLNLPLLICCSFTDLSKFSVANTIKWVVLPSFHYFLIPNNLTRLSKTSASMGSLTRANSTQMLLKHAIGIRCGRGNKCRAYPWSSKALCFWHSKMNRGWIRIWVSFSLEWSQICGSYPSSIITNIDWLNWSITRPLFSTMIFSMCCIFSWTSITCWSSSLSDSL